MSATIVSPVEDPTRANPSKGGDAKLRGYGARERAMPVEPPNVLQRREACARRGGIFSPC
jgi:hypothetical protein